MTCGDALGVRKISLSTFGSTGAAQRVLAGQLFWSLTQRAIQPWFSIEIAASQASSNAAGSVGVSAREPRSCSRRWAVRRNSAIMWS